MNKNQQTLANRRAFVLEQIKRRKNEKVETIVNQIAQSIFLSPATIWNDLKNSGNTPEK